ncbi:uncharacterized protein EV422DRAFT_515594 [Fimicolochytrium jonesii]|uniref:uncharacterized protein n=1 Tax=Fimicolochytrium jonesii TaxID=1396493 RepID=UPI0022FEF767|nr:uncharacterized protein EV422DRAFT_515594 [Fimicolochytrium jonesii]KAI8826165.1 hypothetical protein EV422DRAFT_515594 [Fimicolochytrium jonesii]
MVEHVETNSVATGSGTNASTTTTNGSPTSPAASTKTFSTHPHLFLVHSSPNFQSKMTATTHFTPNTVLLSFADTMTPVPKPSYTTVQISTTEHIELNSNLVYLNHSCDPSCVIDTVKKEVRVVREVREGEELTFFYPSSEWDMDQAFDCWCGSEKCLKRIQGAKYLTVDQLQHHYLNNHIIELITASLHGLPR